MGNDLGNGERWLEGWTAAVPGIRSIQPGLWRADAIGDVSYPAAGHGSVAEVEETSYWFDHRSRAIAAVVGRHPPGGVIADVGGGNGQVARALVRAGQPTFVVEPGSSGSACAHDRGLPVVQAKFEELEVPAGSLAAVGMFDVLEHIPDDRGALARLHQALRPGGRLYLTVPAYDALWSSEDVYAGHYRRYRIDALARLLEASGFGVDQATYLFMMLVPPVLLLRSLPTRLGRAKPEKPSDLAADHRMPGGFAGRTLAASFAWEMERVAAGRLVPFGTTCLVAATRR